MVLVIRHHTPIRMLPGDAGGCHLPGTTNWEDSDERAAAAGWLTVGRLADALHRWGVFCDAWLRSSPEPPDGCPVCFADALPFHRLLFAGVRPGKPDPAWLTVANLQQAAYASPIMGCRPNGPHYERDLCPIDASRLRGHLGLQ